MPHFAHTVHKLISFLLDVNELQTHQIWRDNKPGELDFASSILGTETANLW